MGKIKVLIVDDHAVVRDGIRALLRIQGDIEIVGDAADGKDAIDKAQESTPDVVIMDISMPIMDGLEATRRILKERPKTKVLILSQHDDKEYILEAIKAGATGYVPKRALGAELVSAIRAIYQQDSYLYPSAAAAVIESYRQKGEANPYDSLTAREREILKLIAEGHTSREIAEMLFISLSTVVGHRTKITEKLGLKNRTELIKYAMRKGSVS
ncbi:response regulator [Chloroflexota bacterium]